MFLNSHQPDTWGCTSPVWQHLRTCLRKAQISGVRETVVENEYVLSFFVTRWVHQNLTARSNSRRHWSTNFMYDDISPHYIRMVVRTAVWIQSDQRKRVCAMETTHWKCVRSRQQVVMQSALITVSKRLADPMDKQFSSECEQLITLIRIGMRISNE